jgi:hypothetical protein
VTTTYSPIFTRGNICELDPEYHVDPTREVSVEFETLLRQVNNTDFALYLSDLRRKGERREVLHEVEELVDRTSPSMSMPLILATEQVEIAHTQPSMPAVTDDAYPEALTQDEITQIVKTEQWADSGTTEDFPAFKESRRDRRFWQREARQTARSKARALRRHKVHRDGSGTVAHS